MQRNIKPEFGAAGSSESDTAGLRCLPALVCLAIRFEREERGELIIDCGALFSRENKLNGYARVTIVKRFLRGSVLLFAVFLCSCGLAKVPLMPVLSADVKSIELAKIEVAHVLLIRRLNPIFAIMGSSGMVLDAVIVADHAHEYEKRAGSVNKMCINMFTQTLAQELTGRGYKIGLSQKAYWDYYKKSQKETLTRSDAILRIKIKQMGFWSKSLRAPFVPSLFVQAELIEPINRKVLYSDRFAVGLDAATLKIMALGFGKTAMLPVLDSTATYHDFSDLLEQPEQSRESLLAVVAQAARYIAKGFHRLKPASQLVYDPRLFNRMPEMPLSESIKPEMSR